MYCILICQSELHSIFNALVGIHSDLLDEVCKQLFRQLFFDIGYVNCILFLNLELNQGIFH